MFYGGTMWDNYDIVIPLCYPGTMWDDYVLCRDYLRSTVWYADTVDGYCVLRWDCCPQWNTPPPPPHPSPALIVLYGHY